MQTIRFLICAALLCLAGITASQAGGVPADEARFAALEHEYLVYLLGRYPVVATYLGGAAFDPALAEVDGRLRDYTPEALGQEQAALVAYRKRFSALDPGRLSPGRRIDQTVALAQIEFMLHEQQVRRYQQRSLDTYLEEPVRGVDWQIQGMAANGASGYGTDQDWELVLTRIRAVPAYLATAERQLAAGVAAGNTPDWRMLMEGLDSAAEDAEYFSKTLPETGSRDIATARRAALLAQLQDAGNAAAVAYRHTRSYLVGTFFQNSSSKDVTALKPAFRADRYALGESEYDWALHNNLRVNTSAADLYTRSEPVIEATRASMESLARQIAASHGWPLPADGLAAVRLAFQKLGQDAPSNDAEMLQGYRHAGERIVAYARAQRLFDMPEDYALAPTETPAALRSAVDGAAYYPAPPFKDTGSGRFYVTPTGNDQAELRQQHNYAAMAVITAHEGFPGHDWHYKVMTRYRDEISPLRWFTPGAVEDSSSMWQDSMAIEGWAFYCEGLLAEPQPGAPQGFYTPEERLYQLRGELLRDLRVRLDTGLHTGRIGFEDAVDVFSQTVDFLPGSCLDAATGDDEKRSSCKAARRAIGRYARWPTQAVTYWLGRQQILELRRRAKQEMGSDFSLRVFHLSFMAEGTVPPGYFGDELIKSMEYAE